MTASQRTVLQRSLRLTAAFLLLATPAMAWARALTPGLLVTQVIFAAMLGGTAALFGRTRTPRQEYLVSLGGIALSLAFYFVSTILSGGTTSVAYSWLFGFGLVVVVMGRGVLSTSLLIGLTVPAFALLLPMWEGGAGSEVRHQATNAVAFLLLTVVGASFLRRLSEMEHLREEGERRGLVAERRAMIGKLAEGVAHEVNNPLAAVLCNLDYLRAEVAKCEDPERENVFAETLEALSRIQKIVADLRDFAQEDGDARVRLAVAAPLADAMRLASVKLPVGVRLEDRGLDLAAELEASPRRFVQVVVQLLLNAAAALEGTGRADGVIRIVAESDSVSLRVAVEDNGPGIAPEDLPRLFDTFFVSRSTAAGTRQTFELGLASAREFAQLQGGSIKAENCGGGGARFVLTLPCLPKGGAAPSQGPSRPGSGGPPAGAPSRSSPLP